MVVDDVESETSTLIPKRSQNDQSGSMGSGPLCAEDVISIDGDSDSKGAFGTEVKISTQPHKGTASPKTRDGGFLLGKYREGSILETEVRSRHFPTRAASRGADLKDKPIPRAKVNHDDTSDAETRRTHRRQRSSTPYHISHDGSLRTSSDEDLAEVAARKNIKHPTRDSLLLNDYIGDKQDTGPTFQIPTMDMLFKREDESPTAPSELASPQFRAPATFDLLSSDDGVSEISSSNNIC